MADAIIKSRRGKKIFRICNKDVGFKKIGLEKAPGETGILSGFHVLISPDVDVTGVQGEAGRSHVT
jgi:hypothetical protein